MPGIQYKRGIKRNRSRIQGSRSRNAPIRIPESDRLTNLKARCSTTSPLSHVSPFPLGFPLSPRGHRALAAAFELGPDTRMPMAVSAVAASHLVPPFPARSRRRRAAPRAAAGGLTARARRLRCEFVAGGGNGALSGEDDPRLVDRVRISPLLYCSPRRLVLPFFLFSVGAISSNE